MTKVSPQKARQLAIELQKNQLIKFGEFTLKSGVVSPFYIDLRQAQSFPSTLRAAAECFIELLEGTEANVFLAGVPEAGTPLATATGVLSGRPLLQPRKVVKQHGTKSSVEGSYQPGDKVVLLDDLITKGDSKLEAITQVEQAGLAIEKFVVLIDREQGGSQLLDEKGYRLEAALTISELITILAEEKLITTEQTNLLQEFIRNN